MGIFFIFNIKKLKSTKKNPCFTLVRFSIL
jgi:hypothetical protein